MGTVTLLGCSQGHRRRKSHAASSPAAQVNDLIWPFRTHFSACPRALTAGKTARERDPTYKNSEGFSIVGSRSKKVKDRELGVLKAKGCQTPISFPHHSASASELAPPVQAYFFLSSLAYYFGYLRTRPSRDLRQLLCQTSPSHPQCSTSFCWNRPPVEQWKELWTRGFPDLRQTIAYIVASNAVQEIFPAFG